MRWLFFILLLVNIGLFVWIYPQGDESEIKTVQPVGVQSLILLSELSDDPVAIPKQAEPDAVNTPASGDEMPPLQPQGQNDTPQQTEGYGLGPQLAETKSAEEVSGETLSSAASEEVTAPMSENELVEALPVTARLGSTPPLILRCSHVGPLEKRAQADQLSLQLITHGLQPELISEVSNEQQGYWVLIPPQKDRNSAVKIVRQLRKAGVTDLWRFTSGKLAHAISLGLFKGVGRAEIRRKEIAEKGFDVEVRPRYRQKTQYWQSITYAGDSPLPQDKWQEMVERYPGIGQREIDCQEIASH